MTITEKNIKESLIEQLRTQGKTADFYTDLVNDYISYWKLKKKLIKDIKDKGIRYKSINGNGVESDKTNESIVNLQKTTAIMLKILAEMKLKDPVPAEADPAAGYC